MAKKPLSYLLVAILLVSFTVGVTLNFVKAAGPTNVSGTISSNTTWTSANSPYNFTGNVFVNNSATLTIQPGVTVNFNGYYLWVNGTLSAQGTNNNKITLEIPTNILSSSYSNYPAIDFKSSSKSWNPQTSTGSIIEYCTINSTWSDEWGGAVIHVDSTSPKIDFNTINCTGSYDACNAIMVEGSNSASIIANNTIYGGITANGGIICNNTITYPSAAILVNGNVTVSNNRIYASSVGIGINSYWPSGTENISILTNLVTGCQYGINLRLDTIDYMRYLTVRNNTVADNENGISLMSTFSDGSIAAEITGNNIFNNSISNLQTTYTFDLSCPSNWWGTTNSTAIGLGIYDFKYDYNLGSVNYTPFLTAPNPCAPAYNSTGQGPSPISPVTPPNGSTLVGGIINTNTTWTSASSPYYFTGNVFINDSVILTIQPGARVNFNGFYLRVNGTLNAQGTSSNKINLTIPQSLFSSNTYPAIDFKKSSKSWNAQIGMGSVIENTIINSTWGGQWGGPAILIDSVSPKIDFNTINCTNSWDIGQAITVQGTSAPTIANNTIIGSLNVNGGLICNNTISDPCAAFFLSGNVTVINNKICNSSVGLSTNTYWSDGSETIVIQQNLIVGNQYGLNLQVATFSNIRNITVKNNTVADNQYGICLGESLGDSAGSILSIVGNNIFSNSICNLQVSFPFDLSAPSNWWGTTNSTAIGLGIYDFKYDLNLGAVSYTPYLTTPNPSAPAYVGSGWVPTPISQNTPPDGSTLVSGAINSNTTWTSASSPYYFTGNVFINSSVTLTIQPGVRVNFNGFYLRVNGTLNAQGTTSNKIVFNIPSCVLSGSSQYPAIEFKPCSKSWNSQTSSGSIIENVIINASSWTNDWGDGYAILVDSVSPKIDFNTINSTSSTGGTAITVRGTNPAPTIANNTIYGSLDIGGGLICNNTITLANAVFLQGNVTFSGNTICNSSVGLSVNNYWTDSVETIVIQQNLIVCNQYGLNLRLDTIGYQRNLLVKNNTVADNQYGVYFAAFETDATILNLTLTGNNIFNNTDYNVQTSYSTNINASSNWWGTTNSTIIGLKIFDSKYDYNLGTVNYTPFLTAANQYAPPYGQSTSPSPSPSPSPTLTPTPTPTPNNTAQSNSTATTAPTPSPSPIATPSPAPTPTLSNSVVQASISGGGTVNLGVTGNVTSDKMGNVVIWSNSSCYVLSFTLTGESGNTGFGNITIPKSAVLNGGAPQIFIDGRLADHQGYTQDANNYYVWYTTHFSTHTVQIVFPTEGSIDFTLLTVAVVAVVAIALVAVVALRRHKSNISTVA
jgi:hypothetical protein